MHSACVIALFVLAVTSSQGYLSGTVIGTSGSYNNGGNTIAKAVDGQLSTYFDGPTANGCWVGLDLGNTYSITGVAYASRSGLESRMNGGIFQASNTADFSSGVVNLYTISSSANPSSSSLTTQTFSASAGYRYVRYSSPSNSYGNTAEVQFTGVLSGGAISISTSQDIQTVINQYNGGTTFVLAAGTWTPSSTITLKANDVLSGQGSTSIIHGGVSLTSGCTLSKVAITTTAAKDCVAVSGSNVLVQQSYIGPCYGRGIHIQSGATYVYVYDSYVHTEREGDPDNTDLYDNIFVDGGSNVAIQGNVLAYGESNIEIYQANNVTVNGNFLLNPMGPADPRGQQVQAWGGVSNIYVTNNYALSSLDTSTYKYKANQEDAMNFGEGTSFTVSGNWITGGWSDSGCGIIADYKGNSLSALNNVLYMTGQCGISIASGTNQKVNGNRVLNAYLPDPNGELGNTAMVIYNEYSHSSPPPACGPVDFENNIAFGTKPNGAYSSYWNGGGCGTITNSGNVFDAAANSTLSPIYQKYPPPSAIPPIPKHCTISTPYSKSSSGSFC